MIRRVNSKYKLNLTLPRSFPELDPQRPLLEAIDAPCPEPLKAPSGCLNSLEESTPGVKVTKSVDSSNSSEEKNNVDVDSGVSDANPSLGVIGFSPCNQIRFTLTLTHICTPMHSVACIHFLSKRHTHASIVCRTCRIPTRTPPHTHTSTHFLILTYADTMRAYT